MRRVGIAAAALAVAGGATASMHSTPAQAPLAPVSPQAAAFARQLTPPPFDTIDSFLAQARKAQSQPAAQTVKIDFSPLHLLLAGLKTSK